MKLNSKFKKFQAGGEMPMDPAMAGGAPMPPEAGGAPMGPEGGMPAGGEDPIQQLVMAAQQAVETGDCEAAMAVSQMFLELVAGAGGGAGAPPAPEGQPVYKRGGGFRPAKVVRRVK